MTTDSEQRDVLVGELVEEPANDSEVTASGTVGITQESESCAGCRELTARVERLETELSRLTVLVPTPTLGTTACYWIIIGIHGMLFVIMTAGSGVVFVGIGVYAFTAGAIGSLAVCHVFPVRSILHKFVRTMLSATVVSLAASHPYGLSFYDFYSIVLIYVPPSFFSAWFVAKIFVWTRGWRIVPPGSDGVRPPTKISDILGITLIVAVYTAACRAFIDLEDLGVEVVSMAAIIASVAAVATVSASLMARGVLVPGKKIRLRWAIASFALSGVPIIGVLGFFMLQNGGVGKWPEMLIYIFYAGLSSSLCILSPAATFLLMRSAGYRIAYPGSTLGGLRRLGV